jgi:hypothetical protein
MYEQFLYFAVFLDLNKAKVLHLSTGLLHVKTISFYGFLALESIFSGRRSQVQRK